MPRLHTRTPVGERTFHLYNRGIRGAIFRGDGDRDRFLDLLGGNLRERSFGEVSLFAYCLMATHFHMIAQELCAGGIARLMQRTLTTYCSEFRKTYGGSGPLFPGPYRRKPIRDQKQFRWTLAYVHDNHPSGLDYRYSSHRWYDLGGGPSWLNVPSGLTQFGEIDDYRSYLERRATRKALDADFF